MKLIHREGETRSAGRMAIVIVDMHEEIRSLPTARYVRGSVGDGISKLASLLECAGRLGMPVFLIDYVFAKRGPPGYGDLITLRLDSLDIRDVERSPVLALLREAAPGAIILEKRHESAMPVLEPMLAGKGIGTIVIGGFHHLACVYKTILDAEPSYNIITSPYLMFGKTTDSPEREAEVYRRYEACTRLFHEFGELIAFIAASAGPGLAAK
jgi:nicotinamidase-related amidase